MKSTQFQITTTDNLKLAGLLWEPSQKPRLVVCLVHGLGEHIGRYIHVAKAFTQAGFAFIGVDLRGHGKSEGPRGHIPNYDLLLDDITMLIEKTEERFPDLPRVLYGHSLGGNAVLNYILRRSHTLKGSITTAPWLRLAFEPPALQVTLARLMNRLWPSFTQANNLDTSALSHDQSIVRAYEEDPLVHDRVTARLFAEFYEAGFWALQHAEELKTDLLLMCGKEDRIISPDACREFATKAGKRCSFRPWDGLYHEIHNEYEKDQVLAEMIGWLNAMPGSK
ncbi:MAG: lysophospholipase [Chloroflexota bacterium]